MITIDFDLVYDENWQEVNDSVSVVNKDIKSLSSKYSYLYFDKVNSTTTGRAKESRVLLFAEYVSSEAFDFEKLSWIETDEFEGENLETVTLCFETFIMRNKPFPILSGVEVIDKKLRKPRFLKFIKKYSYSVLSYDEIKEIKRVKCGEIIKVILLKFDKTLHPVPLLPEEIKTEKNPFYCLVHDNGSIKNYVGDLRKTAESKIINDYLVPQDSSGPFS